MVFSDSEDEEEGSESDSEGDVASGSEGDVESGREGEVAGLRTKQRNRQMGIGRPSTSSDTGKEFTLTQEVWSDNIVILAR